MLGKCFCIILQKTFLNEKVFYQYGTKQNSHMKISIHPDYRYLEKDLRQIVSGNYTVEKVFCKNRNIVEKVVLGGKPFVVKTFKRPTLANCLIYTFLRKSKARRAYEYALMLLEKGVKTPFPVAYIEVRKHGFFHTGYLVTEYFDAPTLSQIVPGQFSHEELSRLGSSFVSFTVGLQEKRILPLDYNPGNIFYFKDEKSGGYDFALTDINRMRFGRVPLTRSIMRSFEQFGVSSEHLYKFLLNYSIERGVDIDFCMYQFLSFRIRKKIRRFMKGRLKERLKKKRCS